MTMNATEAMEQFIKGNMKPGGRDVYRHFRSFAHLARKEFPISPDKTDDFNANQHARRIRVLADDLREAARVEEWIEALTENAPELATWIVEFVRISLSSVDWEYLAEMVLIGVMADYPGEDNEAYKSLSFKHS